MFFLLCVLCYYVYLSWIFISYFLCFDCLVLVSCMLCMTTIFSRYFIYLCELFLFVLLGVFFFFFKQKTAYDWRIGDWSSDVCSSDLSRYAAACSECASAAARSGLPVSTRAASASSCSSPYRVHQWPRDRRSCGVAGVQPVSALASTLA